MRAQMPGQRHLRRGLLQAMSSDAPMTEADDIELEEEPVSAEPPLPNGVVVDGKYTILRSLGRGGTGTVYEAQHTMIGHRVALKIVNADRAQRPETLVRFQREAQICGSIRHPNVGQIYDVGTHDGKPYMVLELHEGQSLASVLAESVLPIPAIMEIALQVLSALAAVHDAGVVHRDVKPDNAMLVRALNGDIVVKLVDFGISKLVTVDIRERTLTREGSILGSPDYMAPEQLRGHEVDARTDLYGVGVLLYEAVTGATPFDAENLSDLMAAVLRDSVLPPRELRADCPAELEALILKALSREPHDRFQSAAEMMRQLEQIRATMHYAPGAGIAELRKPMPRRSDRVTRVARRSVAPQATDPPPAPAMLVDDGPKLDEPTLEPIKRKVPLGFLLGIGAVVLAIVAAFAMRSEPRDAPKQLAPAVATPASTPAKAVQAEPVTAAAPPAALVDAAVEDRAQSPKGKRDARPKRAEHELAVAAEAPSGPSVQEQLAEASSAFVLGQMPRAKALYQQILERAPAQPEAWRGLGLVSSRMGQHKDAERAFERYLELRPNAPDADRIREQLAKVR